MNVHIILIVYLVDEVQNKDLRNSPGYFGR